MPACIFLFPNLILTPEEAKNLGDDVVPASLREFLSQSDKRRTSSVFANPALSGFAADQWLWMLLTQRETIAPVAPYLWKGLGGPKVDQEFWALNGYRIENEKLLNASDTFDLDDECDLRDLLSPLARKFGFEVQVLDGRFFFVRKKAWQVVSVPWAAQEGKLKSPADGPEAPQWEELYAAIASAIADTDFNERRSQAGKPRLDGFWLSGGGFEEQLLPYTQIRCVLTEDPFVRGTAEAAGIARRYILSPKKGWPDCPEGDRLCIFDDVFTDEVKSDRARWVQTWNEIVPKLQHLMETAKGFETYYPRLAASDGMRVSLIEGSPETKKHFGLWKKTFNLGRLWLTAED